MFQQEKIIYRCVIGASIIDERTRERERIEKKGYWKISNQFIFRLVNVLNVQIFLQIYGTGVHEPFMSKQMVL